MAIHRAISEQNWMRAQTQKIEKEKCEEKDIVKDRKDEEE